MSNWHDMAEPKGDMLPCDTDPLDPPDKGCCKRIDHENVSKYETKVTWCCLPTGHEGQCSGPMPTVLDPSDFDTGPAASKRRRW